MVARGTCCHWRGGVTFGNFSGATGLYGEIGEVTFADGFNESLRELVRLVVFSVLLLGGTSD